MTIEELKEHDLYVLRAIVEGLEEEQSLDTEIAAKFTLIIDAEIERQKPCEWCMPSEQETYKGVMPLDFISFMEFDGWDDRESKMPKKYCPNCGRKLGD